MAVLRHIFQEAKCPICDSSGELRDLCNLGNKKLIEVHSNEYYGHFILDGKETIIRYGIPEELEELLAEAVN